MIPKTRIEDYNYNLPDERIAKYPLPHRDSSKLLIKRGSEIIESVFSNLSNYIPKDAVMVFNDTKVVPARLHFCRETGAHIEVFCLEPYDPSDYNLSFASTESCFWKCVIGNSKRWKGDVLYFDAQDNAELSGMHLRANLISKEAQTGLVRFEWDKGATFSKVLELCGTVPIPPYLNRETESIDIERYQTVYANIRGSVAAPTAGLHFTPEVLFSLDKKGIERHTVCLHVGAGTFLPVKSSLVSEHPMHREPFVVKKEFIELLCNHKGPLVAVGTTSVRTLESLYYVGVSIIENGEPEDVGQWAPYDREYSYSTHESIEAILEYLNRKSLKELKIGTRIIIVPGFNFRLVDLMVTNFHQPQSTLLLLISAFLGGDWKSVYEYALKNDFRFLSYGDSSLLFRHDYDY